MARSHLLYMCAILAACSGGGDDEELLTFDHSGPGVTFSPMYSAFGGTHTYAVTPSVPSVVASAPGSDPPLAATLEWHVDEKLGRVKPFDALPGAIEITTRADGFTDIEVQGKYRRGAAFKQQVRLNIAKASDAAWDRGEARFHAGSRPGLATLLENLDREAAREADSQKCSQIDTASFPRDSACTSCHDASSPRDYVMITPSQIAGYSDKQLIAIITQGEKPAGGTFNSALLRDYPRPDCVFSQFHAFSVDDEDQPGLLLKLRSLAPQIDELDLQHLRDALEE